MKMINPTWKEYVYDEAKQAYVVPKSDYTITEDGSIRSSKDVADTSTPPSLIVIDEISKFNNYDLDQIDKFAQKYGITVLAAGDLDQISASGTHPVTINGKDAHWQLELSRTDFIRTPKLGVSMRTDNSLKTTNQQKIQAQLNMPNPEIDLEYYQDERGIFGDKVFPYEYTDAGSDLQVDAVLADVKTMINTLKKGEKIGYIYSDKESALFKALNTDTYKEFIDFREGGSAQGLESQYYIIEANPKAVTAKRFLQEVYTGVTRSKQGSLLVTPTTFNKDDRTIKFHGIEVHEFVNEPLSKDSLVRYIDKRKKLLTDSVPTFNATSYTPRTKITYTSNNTSNNTSGTAGSNTEGGSESNTEGGTKEVKGLPAPIKTSTIEESKASLLANIGSATTIEELDNIINAAKTALYPELISDSDIKNAYTAKKNELDPPAEPPQTETILDHKEMVNRFGEIANVDHVTINLDGQDFNIPLLQIPFINIRGESGTNNIVNYYSRNIVVVDIFGQHIPFYMSTGKGGKANVEVNKWYPIFGISKGGWLNKGTQEEINSFYGNKVLQLIAEQLNLNLAIDKDSISGPMSLDDTPQIEFINKGLNPAENNQPDTKELFNKEVQRVTQNIDNLIAQHKKKKEPEPSNYAGFLPISNGMSLTDDADYQELLDKSSETEDTPKIDFDPTKYTFAMQLHSFNTFELGVDADQNGYPVTKGGQQWGDMRIDSVNGLVHIDKLLGKPVRKVTDYANMIGRIRSWMFNTGDKAKLQEKIQKYLGLPDIYITFAYKSTARMDQDKVKNGELYMDGKPTAFSKSPQERTLYNGSLDQRSAEPHTKDLVMIVGTQENGNLLELPFLAFSSPLTLMQLKDSNGGYIFPKVNNYYNTQIKQGKTIHKAVLEVIKNFENDPQLHHLINLFKLWDFTDNGIFYIKDQKWTPAGNLDTLGPQFRTSTGDYQLVDGFDMDSLTNPEGTWLTLGQFSLNPQLVMTDKVLLSLDKSNTIAKTGHPFVLVSYDRDLKGNLISYYKRQLKGEVPVKVAKVYVLPPKVTVGEYFDNLYQTISNRLGNHLIGNYDTSYKLLKILTQDQRFMNMLESRLGQSQMIKQTIDSVDEDMLRESLLKPVDWTSLGLGIRPLDSLFDGILLNMSYTRNTIGNYSGKYSDGINLMTDILAKAGITGVYYNAKAFKNQNPTEGLFMLDYNINGHPFKIHGKLDSPTFMGDMTQFVENWVKLIKQGSKHLYSTDSVTYWTEEGGIGKSEIRFRQPKTSNKVAEFLKKRIGQDYSQIFEEKPLAEALQEVTSQINLNDPDHIAVTYKGQILITDLPVKCIISDVNGNAITGDISTLLDNAGKLTFYAGSYRVDFNSNDRTAEAINTQEQGEVISTVINDEADFIVKKPILNKILDTEVFRDEDGFYDTDMEALFNAKTYADFNAAWDKLTPDPSEEEFSRLSSWREALQQTTDPEVQDMLDKLIKFEQKAQSCPIVIKLQF